MGRKDEINGVVFVLLLIVSIAVGAGAWSAGAGFATFLILGMILMFLRIIR